MSCLTGLFSQIGAIFTAPHQVLLLKHKVFWEYAKVAVGQDFIHTLPSFMMLVSVTLVLWRKPPKVPLISHERDPPTYKCLQAMVSWVCINILLWIWLIFQRIIYCTVWSYWSNESEYREISFPWWNRVWPNYYPYNIFRPPVITAGFISWIISMLFGITMLGYALPIKPVKSFVNDAVVGVKECLSVSKCYITQSSKRLHSVMSKEKMPLVDESEMNSVCDECRSEISTDVGNTKIPRRQEITPISYGTDWTPRPNYSNNPNLQKTASKTTSKTIRTTSGAAEGQEAQDGKTSPRELRHRRGCHTVLPSNCSDKSSGC